MFTLFSRDDVHVVSIDLSPGEYTYKFLVDNDWKINSNQVRPKYNVLFDTL